MLDQLAFDDWGPLVKVKSCLAAVGVDVDRVAFGELAAEDAVASGFSSRCWITRFSGRAPNVRVVAFVGEQLLRGVGDVQLQAARAQALAQAVELDVDDPRELLLAERVEDDRSRRCG